MVTGGNPLPPVFGDSFVVGMNSVSQVNSRWDISCKFPVSWSEIGVRFPGHMLDSQGQQFSSDIE